ncbi:hypothetical protein FF100_16105 [Methylobacterium terricola]|uniref:Uncharacterized protein n=1 Tax=Methylobacterium terricola TaxID=2583531 RepID=A0A5C4LHS8_9HYPH|nr:hypothetical protein [Methylobacterium terricola]TNC12351.1 hypothetical protein FF100_16105 [Methylobacterium terricola]
MERPRSVGIAWYEPGDYPRLRAVMADAGLPESYATWQMSAIQVEREVSRSGVAVARVRIEPEAFLAWCGERGVPPDAKARAAFVREAHEAQGSDAGSRG